VKFTDFPTRADYVARRNGTVREGSYWAPAPGPGYEYWIPADMPVAERQAVRVRRWASEPGTEAYRIVAEF